MDIYRKGDLMARILEKLDAGSLIAADILDSLMTPGFGYEGRKSAAQRKALRERSRDRRKAFAADLIIQRDYQRVHSLLYYLKKQGLVTQKPAKGLRGSLFALTTKGRDKKDFLVRYAWRRGMYRSYESEKSEGITIVIFDIPEKEKAKRVWLRDVLKNMGFVLIQKSVWAARIALPAVFIEDLQKMDILKYVLISSVVKDGMIGGLV
mgnify:CR=1 FL=1